MTAFLSKSTRRLTSLVLASRCALIFTSKFSTPSPSNTTLQHDAREKSDTELILQVDEKNQPVDDIGITRAQMRKDNLFHRSSYIYVFYKAINSVEPLENRLIVQKRVATKDYCPLHYDIATGGIVNINETDEENAYKELYEELGLTNMVLDYHGNFKHSDKNCNVFGTLWTCIYSELLEKLNFQIEEIDSVYIKSIKEILNDIQNNEKYCMDSVEGLKIIMERAGWDVNKIPFPDFNKWDSTIG